MAAEQQSVQQPASGVVPAQGGFNASDAPSLRQYLQPARESPRVLCATSCCTGPGSVTVGSAAVRLSDGWLGWSGLLLQEGRPREDLRPGASLIGGVEPQLEIRGLHIPGWGEGPSCSQDHACPRLASKYLGRIPSRWGGPPPDSQRSEDELRLKITRTCLNAS